VAGPQLGRDRARRRLRHVQFGSACAYFVLTRALLAIHAPDSRLAVALGADWKGKLSAVAYLVAIAVAFVSPPAAIAVYVGVAVVWLVPDRRITRVVSDRAPEEG
jgi:hypothetical protein